MKAIVLFFFLVALTGCVTGSPKLTFDQAARLEKIEVLKEGEIPEKKYSVIKDISAADCSGAPYGGRVWGNAEQAIETLKAKAASFNADAIIDTSCSSVPLVNNCWAAKLCSGKAIVWEKT